MLLLALLSLGATTLTATAAQADAGSPVAGAFKTTTPQKTLYASRFPGLAPYSGFYPTNASTSEYLSTTPLLDLCLTDSTGRPVDAGQPGLLAKVVPQLIRTTTVGSVSTTNPTMLPVPVSDQAANPGCFRIPHAGSGSEDEGTDTFSGYLDNDGVGGYRSGGADVLLAPITLRWGQLQLTVATGQATVTTPGTGSLVTATPDGTAFVGRDLSAVLPAGASAVFTPAQPTGTTYGNSRTVLCRTDAAGGCAIGLADPVAEQVQLLAYDNAANVGGTRFLGSWGIGTVSFRTGSVALASTSGSTTLLSATPVPDSSTDPTATDPAATDPTASPLRPGDVQHYDYTLFDPSGSPLANVTATLRLSNGFFTPDCTDYVACSFAPATTDGALVGNLTSLGQRITLTSDRSGVLSFATTIGRDPGLDVAGTLPVALSVTVGSGGSAGSTTAALQPFTTASTVLANGGTVSLLPVSATDPLNGVVADNGSNLISGQTGLLSSTGSNVLVRLTDQFGNLVTAKNCDVALTVTGVGYLNTTGTRTATACGTFTGDTSPEQFHLDSDDPSPVARVTSVTASWTTPVTVFQALPDSAPTTYTLDADPQANRTNLAQVSLSLYAVDQSLLTVHLSAAPASPTVEINTTVTTTATVTDSQGNPAPNLPLNFVLAGPDDADGVAQADNAAATTDASGVATYSFTSSTGGPATITATVLDSSGTPLTSSTLAVTFHDPHPVAMPTDAPDPTGSPTPTPTSAPAPATSSVTITGPDRQSPAYNSRFVITGTAPALAVVTLSFHKAGTPANEYGVLRTVVADSTGGWSRVITATADYRYYATAGGVSSASVLNQPSPTLTGPADRTVTRGKTYVLTGTAVPKSLVFLHFRQGSTGAYTIVRSITATAAGTWSRPVLATTDYGVYVSRTAADSPAPSSVQLRAR